MSAQRMRVISLDAERARRGLPRSYGQVLPLRTAQRRRQMATPPREVLRRQARRRLLATWRDRAAAAGSVAVLYAFYWYLFSPH